MPCILREAGSGKKNYTLLSAKKLNRTPCRDCTIISWNVRSINGSNKLHSFINYIEDHNADICCLTETWFKSRNGIHTKAIDDIGYKIIPSIRENNSSYNSGGGTAILYKKDLKVCKSFASSSAFSSFEYSFIKLRYLKQNMIITCIYRPDVISISTFCNELDELLQCLLEQCHILLVTGDFNVWAERKNDNKTKKVLDVLKSFGLSQLIHEPTHICGHTLDLLLVNKHQLKPDYKVINDSLDFDSDHFPIFLKIPFPYDIPIKKQITMRNLRNVDMNLLKQDLLSSLQCIDCENDFSTVMQDFKNKTTTVINFHAPVRHKVVVSKKHPEWMDAEYRNSRAKRRKLEKLWKRDQTTTSRHLYIDQRKLCANLAISKKKEFYKNLIYESSNDQGKLFSVVNTMLDTKSKGCVLPSYASSKVLANEFNAFFINKIKSLRESIPERTDAVPRSYNLFNGQKLDKFVEVEESDIIEIIKEHGIKTSPIDTIPKPILKCCIFDLVPYLKILINKSFTEGSAEGFKESIVFPLIKDVKLDKEVKKHYRPVANLIFFSKLIERIAKNSLITI